MIAIARLLSFFCIVILYVRGLTCGVGSSLLLRQVSERLLSNREHATFDSIINNRLFSYIDSEIVKPGLSCIHRYHTRSAARAVTA